MQAECGCTEKIRQVKEITWDEVIKNDRKKLDMDSADPQNRSEWRGRLRGRLVKKPNPQRKTGSKTDMMMMMMMMMNYLPL